MSDSRRRAHIAALVTLLVAVALEALPLVGRAGATTPSAKPSPTNHSLLRSRLLWATVDVCDPPDQPDTIGIRGSMPGDGVAAELMYMRFRMQYHTLAGWTFVAANADSGWVQVGSARYRERQAGDSFTFTPVAGQPAYRLRGLVEFRWTLRTKVVRHTMLISTRGHPSGSSGDPADYSTASCVIGPA